MRKEGAGGEDRNRNDTSVNIPALIILILKLWQFYQRSTILKKFESKLKPIGQALSQGSGITFERS